MFLLALSTAALAVSSPALAVETHFSNRPAIGSGAANVVPAVGGEYVYGAVAADTRPLTAARLIGPAPRTDYIFLTAAEEESLIRIRDARRVEQVRSVLVASRAKYVAKRPAYNWPKVVLRGSEVCVPELASSEAVDWKDHLTCYPAKGGDRVNP